QLPVKSSRRGYCCGRRSLVTLCSIASRASAKAGSLGTRSPSGSKLWTSRDTTSASRRPDTDDLGRVTWAEPRRECLAPEPGPRSRASAVVDRGPVQGWAVRSKRHEVYARQRSATVGQSVIDREVE